MPDKVRINTDETFQKDLTNISTAWNLVEYQRDKSNESIRFVDVAGGQWEDGYKKHFANRPRMEMDMVSRAINRFNGEWKSNRFSVKFLPDDAKTSEKDAELLNGLFRRDWRRDNGNQSADNAVNEMSKGGLGGMRLSTRYLVEDDPDDKRQVIVFKPIHNAYNTVVWDPQAKLQDKSDARWCAVLISYTQDAFKEAYPDYELSSVYTPQNRDIFNLNNMRTVYVAEFYKIEKKKGLAYKYVNDMTGETRTLFKDEIKDVVTELADLGFKKRSERRITKRTVTKSLMYGGGYIEKPKRIAGKMIPIAPLYGYRSYVDGQEYWYGMVEKNKDAQRLVNMGFSKNAENAATSTKSVPIFTDDEIAGKENDWSEAHLGKTNYLTVNSVDEDGEPIQPRQVQYTQPAQVDPNTQTILNGAAAFIQGQAGAEPQEVTDPEASGKAINAARVIEDMVTYTLLDNIAEMMMNVGKIYHSMADEIYDGQRFEKLVTEDNTDKSVLLQEYVLDRRQKRFVRVNDIVDKTFEVIVETGPSFASRRRETADLLKDILQNTPNESPYFPVLYAALIENIDGPGMEDVKQFNRKQKIILGIQEPETPEEIAFVQQLQAEKPPSAQEEYLKSAAEKERSEAISNQTASLENVANSTLKGAQAEKTQAETAEILAGIERDNAEALVKFQSSLRLLNRRTGDLIPAI